TPALYTADDAFPIGGSKVVRGGGSDDRVAVIAAGITLHEAVKAADDLAKGGLRVRVIDAYSVKPIDGETLAAAAKATGGRIVVVEDHWPEGGIGDAVLAALRDRPVRTSIDGEASLDADERLRATASAIDETLARAGRRVGEIAVVAFSTFWHSVLGVDERGRPTTRVLTWADTRARAAAAALRGELDPTVTHARTGCTFHASYLPAKLRYLRESDPAAFARTRRWLSLGEYTYLRLFGDGR